MQAVDRNAMVLRSRELRRSPTLPEGLLWQVLRTRPDGFKFRRQHPLGRYIVDFYCPTKKLVVEVDGESHDMGDRPARDARRDTAMRRRGFQVVRFSAPEVMGDLQSVVTAVLVAARR